MSKKITTLAQFKAAAVAALHKVNYLQRGTTITWIHAQRATWRDGSKGFSGQFTVAHESHRTVTAVATFDSDGLMVR